MSARAYRTSSQSSTADGTTHDITITIDGAEDAPTLDNLIADQSTTEDAPFSFTVPANTFSDVDASDTLTYTATLSDDSPLPAWLSFDALTQTFSGTPTNSDLGHDQSSRSRPMTAPARSTISST